MQNYKKIVCILIVFSFLGTSLIGVSQGRIDNLDFETSAGRNNITAIEVFISTQKNDFGRSHEIQDIEPNQDVYFHILYGISIQDDEIPPFDCTIKLDGSDFCQFHVTDTSDDTHIGCCSNSWTATTGSHTVCGITDSNNDVDEDDETDNTICDDFVVGESWNPPEWVLVLQALSGSKEEWKDDHWYVKLSFSSYLIGSINGDLPVNVDLGEYFGGSYLSKGFFGSSIEVFMYPGSPSRNKVIFQPNEQTLWKFDILGNTGELYAGLDIDFDNNLEINNIKLDTGGKIKIKIPPGFDYYIESLKVGLKFQPYLLFKAGTYVIFNPPDEWDIYGPVVTNHINRVGGYFGIGAGIEVAGGIVIVSVEADCGGTGTWYFKPPTDGEFFDSFEAELFMKVHLYAFLIIDVTLVDTTWSFSYPDKMVEKIESQQNLDDNPEVEFLPRDYNEPIWTGNNTNILINEVFPSAAPTIANNSGQQMLVWAYDNQNKPHVDGVELQYSIWNGNEWSDPDFLSNDDFFEIMPSLTFLENGDALCVFTYVPADVEEVSDIFEGATIGYSYWDHVSGEWSDVRIVAQTEEISDQYPIVVSEGDSALCVWLSTNQLGEKVAYASFWDQGQWHDTQQIYTGTVISPPSISLHNDEGFYTFVVDEDNNPQEYKDQEIYLCNFTSQDGILSTIRITNDRFQDASPNVAINGDKLLLTWVKKNETKDFLIFDEVDNTKNEIIAIGKISAPSLLVNKDDIYIGFMNYSDNSLKYCTKQSQGWSDVKNLFLSQAKISHFDWMCSDSEISAIVIERDNESLEHRRMILIHQFEPPTKPSVPNGNTSGKIDILYNYTSNSTDLNGDQIYYLFDWDDGTNSGWLGPFDSGIICKATHTWSEKGNYEIKVKAKDIYGEESPWSDPLAISMPKNKAINPFLLFLERLMERFPILKQILQPIYDKLVGFY